MTDRLVTVVTGGASGIGKALAATAAERGMAVAIADVEAERAKSVASELGRDTDVKGYACDVTDPASLAELAHNVSRDFGGVNYLFNNAGVAAGSTVEATSPADAAWVMSVNFMGVFHGVQAFLPYLKEAVLRKQLARIINTGSENSLGLPALGPTSVYTASKHAVLGLSDALRRDLKESGIAVSILCPGLVQTDIYDSYRNRPADFGGEKRISEKRAEAVIGMMQQAGQAAHITAQICFDGIYNDEFIIIADSRVRGFAEKRHAEVAAALVCTDARLAALGENYPPYE
jgi:NAD(P)-dependent dehydrogenase (short-subunit alcohol dehydrogenase family)